MSFQLAVNTSEKRGQLLFLKDNDPIENILWESGQSHSEVLTVKFKDLLDKYLIQASQFSKIYCVTGPGSFTGLRVGVSFCKTLSYLYNIAIHPINSLDLLALNCRKSDRLIVSLIDAQKNSVFCSIYKRKGDRLETIRSNEIIPIKSLGEVIKSDFYLCGHGLNKYKDYLTPQFLSRFKFNNHWENMDLKYLVDFPLFKNELLCLDWKSVQPFYIKVSAPEEKLRFGSK